MGALKQSFMPLALAAGVAASSLLSATYAQAADAPILVAGGPPSTTMGLVSPGSRSASKPANNNAGAVKIEKRGAYEVVALPSNPQTQQEQGMGVSSEMFKDRYDNHVVFVVFERAGSKEAKDQQRLLDDILPVLAQHSKRPISVIKAPLGYQDATGKVVPNYEAAMIGMIKSDLSRFTTTDGINLMPDKVGYPDAYAEMYIGNGQDAKRVWYFTPRLTPSTATYEQTKKVVGNAAGRAIYASNREFEAAAPHTSAVDKATPDSPAFAVK